MYDIHRMPRVLWDAIAHASATERWFVCGYAPVGQPEPVAELIGNSWEVFGEDEKNPARKSPEWIAYSPLLPVAILAGFDVTLVGASAELADEVDCILNGKGTSLRDLTLRDFGPEESWAFLNTVLG
ncbi:hypothetical protein VI08_04555 [Luteibacter yeojuensis]|uniref:Uncharacterized protein n=2 Tax=Luteibacter yeojuensis TaxID=345309 RepID=A0A0F3L214_9GAMM|nr:hypothetical protein VI08_04555 [Luteibacter yeojuensis]